MMNRRPGGMTPVDDHDVYAEKGYLAWLRAQPAPTSPKADS